MRAKFSVDYVAAAFTVLTALAFGFGVATYVVVPSVVEAHEPDNVHAHAVAQTSPIETPSKPTAVPTVSITPTPVITAPVPIPEPFPDGLPDTAAGAIEQLRYWIITLQGLITTTLITWLRKLPGLNEEGRSKIAGGLAAAISGIVSLVIALLVTYGATLAGFLDTNGFWNLLKLLLSIDGAPILVGAWPATYLAWLLKKYKASRTLQTTH